MHQRLLFDTTDCTPRQASAKIDSRAGSFVDNMKLPVHRWFRYSAGFSAEWVRTLLKEKGLAGTERVVLDPFAGIATTLAACNSEHIKSIGLESHPFVSRLAETKLEICQRSVASLKKLFSEFLYQWKSSRIPPERKISPFLEKCYSHENLYELLSMKKTLEMGNMCEEDSRIIWFVITAILRSCSCVGTAQWQYVLPNKKKINVRSPYEAFREKVEQIIDDVARLRRDKVPALAQIVRTDARNPSSLDKDSVDIVITSPPYPNNYDYADATRLEMTFWNEIDGWSDLHATVRASLLCSCTQHSAADRLRIDGVLSHPILVPIRSEIGVACETLGEIRKQKGGKKTYHTMVAAYFRDLGLIIRNLRQVCRPGAEMCFVIGDSAPYGIYIPVDHWLGQLAIAEGFHSFRFEKIRDRNIKWKNRKHNVPLKEGRLWIQG